MIKDNIKTGEPNPIFLVLPMEWDNPLPPVPSVQFVPRVFLICHPSAISAPNSHPHTCLSRVDPLEVGLHSESSGLAKQYTIKM